ncbi:MAG TPA: ABC transporter permease [Candidatus Angelobacter sp.]|nr:ABC transporter permease [Candidatus Angelobacter sp.]
MMTGWIQDIRYARRMMLRTPVFSVAVILTVALAIAANTSIFSFVNAELLRPLPFRQPNRLAQIAEKNDKLNLPIFGSSALNFLSWREQQHSFQEIAAVGFNTYTLTGAGNPEQHYGNLISPALMRVLGLSPVAGRTFSDEEEKPGSTPVAMISEGLWRQRFGAEQSLIGRTITLNGQATTIVGIAPAALSLISAAEVYTPLTIDPAKEIRLNHVLIVFGRLKDGSSLQQAQAEMDSISSQMDQMYPEMRDWGIRLLSMEETFVSPDLKTGLLVLLFAVAFVLLIACANIANLLLSRASAREQEIAVRTAAGASRARLIRQLLIESLTLASLGGVIGCVGAFWAISAINRALPPNTLAVPDVHADATVLLFAAAATIFTGLLFGLAPAWRMTRLDINEVLKQAGRTSSGGTRSRLRNGLAAAELALATVLLIGAGLLIKTLGNLEHAHLGFDSHGLITFQIALPTAKYPLTAQAPQFFHALLDSIQATAGVRDAAVSSGIPFGAGSYTTSPVIGQGSVLPPGTSVAIDWRMVSSSYFKTMSIALLRGRVFTDADGPTSPPVAIVSQDTAKRIWGDADPIGRSFYRAADPRTAFTVVGIVGDVRNTALNQQSPALYYPLAWRIGAAASRVKVIVMDVVVRTDGSPEALVPTLRQKVGELDPDLPLANIRTMQEWISNNAAQPRLNARLLSLFAMMALLIAAIGIYAVLAYSVTQRTREIGLRIALGAQPAGVLRLVVSEGMKVALVGICTGLLGALAVGRAVSSLLYGVTVHDPSTFAGVAVMLTVIALAACFLPARRAAKVDPMVALRRE